jgi:hypothetical protein
MGYANLRGSASSAARLGGRKPLAHGVGLVGVRLAVPSWFGRAMEMKRVRQAVPLHLSAP